MIPHRAFMRMPHDIPPQIIMRTADRAANLAIGRAPRSSGSLVEGLDPYWGTGGHQEPFVGLQWIHDYTWYQEVGISPFTMRSLAGRTIPMWVDDDDGKERAKNPKIKTRVRKDGKLQVLVFRKVGVRGTYKRKVETDARGNRVERMVPENNYPGAPGRINRRAGSTFEGDTRKPGQITKGNVGVKWRHPGMAAKGFISTSILQAVREARLPVYPIEVS